MVSCQEAGCSIRIQEMYEASQGKVPSQGRDLHAQIMAVRKCMVTEHGTEEGTAGDSFLE